MLNVEVISARGIRALDKGKYSDPFCVLKHGQKKVKTTVKKKTLIPVWNESFSFDKPPPGSFLQLIVYDDDMMGRDKLGCVQVSLDSIPPGEKVNQWYTLEKLGNMKEVSGEVRLEISIAFEGESIDELAERQFDEKLAAFDEGGLGDPNELLVAIIQARDLPIMDKNLGGFEDSVEGPV